MENQTTDKTLITEDNSYWVTQEQARQRLETKDFYKTLITQGYFNDYVKHLIGALVEPENSEYSTRATIVEKLVGVAGLQEYLYTVEALSASGDGYEEIMDEHELKETKRVEDLAIAYTKAAQDPDFKLLIEQRYGDDFSRNQISLITNSTILNSGKRTNVLEALAGVSTLDNYLVDIKRNYADILEDEFVEE